VEKRKKPERSGTSVFFTGANALKQQGGSMLIIGRKRDQKIIINDDIEITILEIGRNRVRFGVQAPKSVRIYTKLQQLPTEQPATESATESDDATTREITVPIHGPEERKTASASRNQSLAGTAAGFGRRSG
jgi:carbon storage regulator